MEVQLTSDQKAFARRAAESGTCRATKKPYKKRLHRGRAANAVARRFWRPSMTPALHFPVARAASSRRNPCRNQLPRRESADAHV